MHNAAFAVGRDENVGPCALMRTPIYSGCILVPRGILGRSQTINSNRDEHSTRAEFRRLHDAPVQEIP